VQKNIRNTLETHPKIQWKYVGIFLSISFGLAWPVVCVIDYIWLNDKIIMFISHAIAMLTPGIACLVVKKIILKQNISRNNFAVGPVTPYFIIIGSCALLWGIPQIIDILWGKARLADSSNSTILWTIIAVVVYLVPAFGEELGWRGFLLPELLPLGTRKALIIHGAIWGAWHWPLLFVRTIHTLMNSKSEAQDLIKSLLFQTFVGMIAMVLISAMLGAIFGYVMLRYHSLLLVTVLHAYYDYFRDMLRIWFKPGQLIQVVMILPICSIVILGVILLLRCKKQASMSNKFILDSKFC